MEKSEKGEKEKEGKKGEEKNEKEEKKIDLSSLKVQTAIALVIFVFAVAIFVIFYRPPVEELAFNISELNIASNLTNITSATNVSEVKEECKNYIYLGGEKRSYEYLLTSSQMTSTMKSNFIGKESRDGKEYYVRENLMTISTQGQQFRAYSKIYMDENFTCAFQEVNATIQGKEYNQQVPCEKEQMVGKICADNLKYIGNETVKVGAGIFDTKVYKFEGTKIWISEGIEVPIKMESEDLKMELLSYK
jgi:hypothetical protein